ncbi:hypothetical protein F2Q70_00001548 [Brassica cretica]|uniref:DUF4283 domain-containing protein n=1 Tax=Brassica cretica TaxID=69181 RepID=A0A8S9J529_BRACR|nr:hypothetical protein F2Q70_00001548 [Brassica cretica]
MFHTAQWSSQHSASTPSLKAIKIWAHLTGVPLDLRHQESLSLVAGLVGDPKETDDFTKNLVSLTLSHVKVEVDLTKPLPSVMEFERQSGEVVEVLVHYLWVPPTCSHCHELGHIVQNCLSYIPPPPADPPGNQSKAQGKRPLVADQTSSQKPSQKPTQSPSQTPSQTPRKIHQKKKSSSIIPTQQYVPVIGNKFSQLAQESNSGSSLILPASSPMQVDNPISSASTVNSPPCFSPEPNPRPSLKRCRSSPTLSPPPSSHPNPFAPLSSTNCQATIDSTLSLQTFLSITPYPKNTSAPIQTTSLNTSTPISQDSTSQLANHSSFSLTRESISHGGDPPTLN